MVEKTDQEKDVSSECLFESDEDSMDALLIEALQEFEECRIRVERITGRPRNCAEVSSSIPALKNLTRDLVLLGGEKPLG